MKSEHPSPDMTLPISFEIYQQLVSASVKSGFSQDIWESGAAAIRDWTARNVVWVLLPNSSIWKSAGFLRAKKKSGKAR
jgi:hypothetical protein